ncbi:hypothetical protein T484DRAFT_1871148 [Baffinella frigidus]|nr:hypothetical protein T484DRAFT_1871148 [Cryptophyta sp. CCMP2293]
MPASLRAEAANRARQPRWSAGGGSPGLEGQVLGLPLDEGLERGAMLELFIMWGEERRAFSAP